MGAIEQRGNVKLPDCQDLERLVEDIRYDNNVWVCIKAISILKRFIPLDSQVITNLLHAYPDESDEVSEKVIEAIGQMGHVDHPGLTDILISVLQQDPSPQVRATAAKVFRSLGQTDVKILSILKGSLADEDARVRREAAKALGELGDEDTLKDLCHLWSKIPRGRGEGVHLALDSLSHRLKWRLTQERRGGRLSLTPIE